jgi:hypothetical protein
VLPSSNHDARFHKAMLAVAGRFPRISLASAKIVWLPLPAIAAHTLISAASAQLALNGSAMVS